MTRSYWPWPPSETTSRSWNLTPAVFGAAKPLCWTIVGLFLWSIWTWHQLTQSLFDWYVIFLTAATVFNGGHCPRAGHPCMACTEKGYPDSFVPFVVRS
jgi:hypothetical protein